MMLRLAALTLALSLTGAFAAHTRAAAQTVYKWTDPQGTVHFSDHAPADGTAVEERNLPPAIPLGTGVAADAPAAADDAAAENSVAAAGSPAKLVMVSNKTERSGPSSMRVSGVVKNVGGSSAQGVQVAVTVLDSGQGNPCLQTQVAVEPSGLGSGETATFQSDLDNACFLGEPQIDLTPIGN